MLNDVRTCCVAITAKPLYKRLTHIKHTHTHPCIIFREPFAKIINAFKINHNAVYLDLPLFVQKQPHRKCARNAAAFLPASNDYDNVFDLRNQTIQ